MVSNYLYHDYICMYRMTNGRLEVRIFIYLKEPYHCQVGVIRLMLILLNYGLKHLKRRCYTYTFHVNPLTHVDALSSTTFYLFLTTLYVTLIVIHFG